MSNHQPSNGDAIQHGRPHQNDSDSSEYDSDDESTNKTESWTCKKCHMDYDVKADPPQFWICCSLCNAAYDLDCLNMSKRTYNALNKCSNACWLCDLCKAAYMPDPTKGLKLENLQYKRIGEKLNSLRETSHKIAQLQIQLQETCQNINSKFDESLKTVHENLSQEINKVSKEIPVKTSKTWANITNPTPAINEAVTVSQVRKALIEVSEYDKEMELRSRGIVVYRAPESQAITREARKADDMNIMKDLVAHIKCEDVEIISTDRLGKYDEERVSQGKHRPIKVRFTKNSDRDKVLKSLSRLKDADPMLKRLSIRQDLNDSQRAELKAKLGEAYAKTNASKFTIFRVRGSPGDYFLKQFPKPLSFQPDEQEPKSGQSDSIDARST